MGFGTAFQHSSSCDARGWIQRVAKAEPGAGEGHFFAAMNRHVEHFRIHTPRRETFFNRAATTWRLFPPRFHDVRLFSIAPPRRGAFFRQGSTTCDLFLSRHDDMAPFSAKAPRRVTFFYRGTTTWRLFWPRPHDVALFWIQAPKRGAFVDFEAEFQNLWHL